MWRLLQGIAGGLLVVVLQQSACSWVGPTTVLCHTTGACLPEMVCPSTIPGVVSLRTLYSGYVRVLLLAGKTTPALTCLRHRLSAVDTSIDNTPLAEVHRLETDGLSISADTKSLMRGIETKVVVPLRVFAESLSDKAAELETLSRGICSSHATNCDTELNQTIKETRMYVRKTCMDVGTDVTVSATEATTMALRMDQFAGDLRKFGVDLKHEWIPKLQQHKDTKIPTSVKVFGIATIVGVGTAAVASAPATIVGLVMYGVPTAAVGTLGSYVVHHFESKWADDGQFVRNVGVDITPYASMVENGVVAVQTAARGLDDITDGLLKLRGTLEETLDTPRAIAAWTAKMKRISGRLRAEIGGIEAGITAERRHLVGAREKMHIEGSVSCL